MAGIDLHGPAVTQDSFATHSATKVAGGPNDLSVDSVESSGAGIYLHTCSLWFLPAKELEIDRIARADEAHRNPPDSPEAPPLGLGAAGAR